MATPDLQILKTFWRYNPINGRFFWVTAYKKHCVGGVVKDYVCGKYCYLYIPAWRGKHAIVSVHRLAWAYMTGSWPPDYLDVEHIDGNPINNRWYNLSLVTRAKNKQNLRDALHRDNISGVRGISWNKTKRLWIARITVNRRIIYLGYYATKDEAAAARKTAELEYYPSDRHP